mmetsp:Transcript_89682/g.192209  ORF Transcript_89682/g.192209 Transcript_89682/m.192209 type:complete len:346 (-) Transcript_89682:198-1235(-)
MFSILVAERDALCNQNEIGRLVADVCVVILRHPKGQACFQEPVGVDLREVAWLLVDGDLHPIVLVLPIKSKRKLNEELRVKIRKWKLVRHLHKSLCASAALGELPKLSDRNNFVLRRKGSCSVERLREPLGAVLRALQEVAAMRERNPIPHPRQLFRLVLKELLHAGLLPRNSLSGPLLDATFPHVHTVELDLWLGLGLVAFLLFLCQLPQPLPLLLIGQPSSRLLFIRLPLRPQLLFCLFCGQPLRLLLLLCSLPLNPLLLRQLPLPLCLRGLGLWRRRLRPGIRCGRRFHPFINPLQGGRALLIHFIQQRLAADFHTDPAVVRAAACATLIIEAVAPEHDLLD